jgi:hypothetical protein
MAKWISVKEEKRTWIALRSFPTVSTFGVTRNETSVVICSRINKVNKYPSA